MTTEPTDIDMARNLLDDLRLVEGALEGPWAWVNPCGEPLTAEKLIHVYRVYRGRCTDVGVVDVLTVEEGVLVFLGGTDERDNADMRRDTRDAIAMFRDGWPAAIRRALAAEAEVERLKALLAERGQ